MSRVALIDTRTDRLEIPTELDASFRAFDNSSSSTGDNNPYRIVTGISRTLKQYKRNKKSAVDAPLWTVVVVMICVGFKTYLLSR
jgi:hypothetical protein